MDYKSRMGGTTMRIELEKKAKGYKPVKGNELKIIKHLLDQNFYNSYSIEGSRIEVDGRWQILTEYWIN